MSSSITATQAAKIATIAGTSLQALETIGSIIDSVLKGTGAVSPSSDQWTKIYTVLHAIREASNSVTRGLNGEVSIGTIEDALRELRDTLTKNDESIDIEIDSKFPA